MAAANEKATASINKKLSLGGGTYLYIGTLALGTEYKTGGYDLTTAASERYSLPEKIDYLDVQGAAGYTLEYAGGKVVAYRGGEAKAVGEQVPAATNLSASSAVPFICIGC